jgi:hypothetical protein
MGWMIWGSSPSRGMRFSLQNHPDQMWGPPTLCPVPTLRMSGIFLVPYGFEPGRIVGIAIGYGLDGPGIESRWGARFSAPVQTGPGANPASCTMGTGSFPGVKSGRGVMLTPHPLLLPWSWKGITIPLLPLWAVRLVQSLSACTQVHYTLPLPYGFMSAQGLLYLRYLQPETVFGCLMYDCITLHHTHTVQNCYHSWTCLW